MKHKNIFVAALLLAGCNAITQPDTNYAKVGIFQDRFDGMYYHYAEAGKTIPIDEHNSINTLVGVQEGSGNELINNKDSNLYWEVNYQLTF